ncbi:hypothetical protein YC2023_051097 [Brassica napus]
MPLLESNIFLDHFSQCGCNGTEVWNKPPIETSKTMETPHFTHDCWTRPVTDGLDLLLVNSKSISTYKKNLRTPHYLFPMSIYQDLQKAFLS